MDMTQQRFNRFSSRAAEDKYLLDYHNKDHAYAEGKFKKAVEHLVNKPPFIVSGGRLVRSTISPTTLFHITPMKAIDSDFNEIVIPTKLSNQSVPTNGTYYVTASFMNKDDSSTIANNFTTSEPYAKIIEDSYKITYKNSANVTTYGSIIGSSPYVPAYANNNKVKIKLDVNDAIEVTIPNTTPGSVTTTNSENYTITTGVNDTLDFTIDSVNYVITLTAGSRTAAQIISDINTQVQLITPAATVAYNVTGGKLKLNGEDGVDYFDITINVVANSAYTTLGIATGNYTATHPTLANIITAINNEFDVTIATNNAGALKIQTPNAPGAIAYEAIAGDFYTELFVSVSTSDSITPVDLNNDIVLGKVVQAAGDITITEGVRTRSATSIKQSVYRDNDGNIKAELGYVEPFRNVVLQSPNLTLWTVSIDDDGNLQTVNVATGGPTTITFLDNNYDYLDLTISNAGVLSTIASSSNEETGLHLESIGGFVYRVNYDLTTELSDASFIVEASSGQIVLEVKPNGTYKTLSLPDDPDIADLEIGDHWWNSSEKILKYYDGIIIQSFQSSGNTQVAKFFDYKAHEITNDFSQANSDYYKLFKRSFVPGRFYLVSETGEPITGTDANSKFPSAIRDQIGGGTGTNISVTTNKDDTFVNFTPTVTNLDVLVVKVTQIGNSTLTTFYVTSGVTTIASVTVATSDLVLGYNLINFEVQNLDLLTYQLKVETDSFTTPLQLDSNGVDIFFNWYYKTVPGVGLTDEGFSFNSKKHNLTTNDIVDAGFYPAEVDLTTGYPVKVNLIDRYIVYTYYKTATTEIETTLFDIFTQKTIATETITNTLTDLGFVHEISGNRQILVETTSDKIIYFYGSIVDGTPTTKIYSRILDITTMTLGQEFQVNEYDDGTNSVVVQDIRAKGNYIVYTYTIDNRTDSIGDPGYIGTYSRIMLISDLTPVDTGLGGTQFFEFYVGEIGNVDKTMILTDFNHDMFVYAIQRGTNVVLKLLSSGFNFIDTDKQYATTRGFTIASSEYLIDLKVHNKRAFIVTGTQTATTITGTMIEVQKKLYMINLETFATKELTVNWLSISDTSLVAGARMMDIQDWELVNDEVIFRSNDYTNQIRYTYAHNYETDVQRQVREDNLNAWTQDPFLYWENSLETPSNAQADGASAIYLSGYVYRLEGASTTVFERFDVVNGGWASLAASPAVDADSTNMAVVGSTIYVGVGATTDWYSYAGGVWTNIVSDPAPAAFGTGACAIAIGTKIYVVTSGTAIYYYDTLATAGTRWSAALAVIPTAVGTGACITTDGTNAFLFIGNDTTSFYRYNVSGNTWSGLLTAPPTAVGQGSAVTAVGTVFYLAPGYLETNVIHKYDSVAGTWVDTTTSIPGYQPNFSPGYSLTSSSDYLFSLASSNASFTKYNLITEEWTLGNLPNIASGFFTVKYDDTYMYMSGNSTAFYKMNVVTGLLEQMTAAPAAFGAGAKGVKVGEYIYALRGNTTTTFYRYDIAANTWSTLSAYTGANIGIGSTLVAYGGYIYASTGAASVSQYYRYDINLDSWSAMTSIPGAGSVSGTSAAYVQVSGVNYIYLFVGNSTAFYRYNISSNTWSANLATGTSPTFAITGAYNGAAAVGDGTIYVLSDADRLFRYNALTSTWYRELEPSSIGGYNNGATIQYINDDLYFFVPLLDTLISRYNPSNNELYALQTIPVAVGIGGSSILTTSGPYIYTVVGASGTDFYIYDITNKNWSPLTDVPFTINAGSASVELNGKIYVLQGTSTDFFDYTVSSDTWGSALSTLPLASGAGSAIVSDGTNLYATRGGGNTNFYKYTVGTDTWSSLTVVPFSVGAGGSAVYSDGYIYVFGGAASTNFQRYSVADNTWSSLTAVPVTLTTGSDSTMVGDYIFVNPGSSAVGFYRYHIPTDTWESMALDNIPVSAADGANTVSYKNHIFFLPAGGTDFYMFSASSNTFLSESTLLIRNNNIYSFYNDINDETIEEATVEILDTELPVPISTDTYYVPDTKTYLGTLNIVDSYFGLSQPDFYAVNLEHGKIVFKDATVAAFDDATTDLYAYFLFSTTLDQLRADNLLAEGSATSIERSLASIIQGEQAYDGNKTFNDDVVINGTLTVLGQTVTFQSTVTQIEDQTIILNKNGTDFTSAGSGLVVERITINGSLIYDNSLKSKWKCGDQGAEKEILTTIGRQAIERSLTILSEGITVTGVSTFNDNIVINTSPTLGTHVGNRNYNDARYLQAAQDFISIASAATTDIGSVTSQSVHVTGAVSITSFGTVAAGTYKRVRFASALTLTYNATSLILPGKQNITTAANDILEAISLGSGNWQILDYQRANGIPIESPWVDVASAATTDIGAVDSDNIRITGAVTITSLGTANSGVKRSIRFASSLILTYNATSLKLPGKQSITTATDDTMDVISLGSGNWLCFNYQRANGVSTERAWVDVASAATTDIGAVDSDKVRVTGVVTITSLGTANEGVMRNVRFASSLTLTHNATSLILPWGASIDTKSDDTAVFVSLGSGNWLCVSYKFNEIKSQRYFDKSNKDRTIASATTTDLASSDEEYVIVTGVTTITSLGLTAGYINSGVGIRRLVRFTGSLTLTHHTTDLILPDKRNITTQAGDTAWFVCYDESRWVCVSYKRAISADAWTSVASASTITLHSLYSRNINITGNTNITNITDPSDTTYNGMVVKLKFNAALTISHLGAGIIFLPGAKDITTAADDVAEFVYDSTIPYWRCTSYTKANGLSITESSSTSIAAAATTELGSVINENITITTGAATITSFGTTAPTGAKKFVRFSISGTITLTNSGTMVLPGNADITVTTNDTCVFRHNGAGTWICLQYQRDSGATVNEISSTSIASAATTNLGSSSKENITVTGTTTITSFGSTAPAGAKKFVTFSSALLTITHNATSLILPSAQNIVTAANDTAIFQHIGSGNWICMSYTRASGATVNEISTTSIASAATTDLGSSHRENITVTGTTTITSFGSTAPIGAKKFVTFSGALTLTHNATSLILPFNGDNILTTANDTAIFQYLGSGNWLCLDYKYAVTSGTFSATTSSLSNLSVATVDMSYIRIGNVVTCAGTAGLTSTVTTGIAQFNFSLPITPINNFSAIWQCAGTAAAINWETFGGSNIIAATGTKLANMQLRPDSANAQNAGFSFSYIINT